METEPRFRADGRHKAARDRMDTEAVLPRAAIHAGNSTCPLSDWLFWRSCNSANFRSSSGDPVTTYRSTRPLEWWQHVYRHRVVGFVRCTTSSRFETLLQRANCRHRASA